MISTAPKTPRVPSTFPALMAAGIDKERGKRVELLMSEQGWDVAHLARLIRVDRKAVYDWKNGKGIGSESLERLAVALETTRRFIETGEGAAHYPRSSAPAVLLKQLADALEEHAGPDA